MGMSIDATLFFGLDLGGREYNEPNYEITNEGLEALFDEDWESTMDTMLDEFVGWTEEHLSWSEKELKREQIDRHNALLKSVGIGYGSAGYEYDNHFLYIGKAASSYGFCGEVNFNDNRDGVVDSDFGSQATDLHIENLRRFLVFLDNKGFVISPQHRQPKWYLSTSYSF